MLAIVFHSPWAWEGDLLRGSWSRCLPPILTRGQALPSGQVCRTPGHSHCSPLSALQGKPSPPQGPSATQRWPGQDQPLADAVVVGAAEGRCVGEGVL